MQESQHTQTPTGQDMLNEYLSLTHSGWQWPLTPPCDGRNKTRAAECTPKRQN